jgi:hypothetical protein
MLSSERADMYRSMSGLAMVEIAGRDSVAAAVQAVMEEGFTDLLPTYVYTGTEHGNWSSVAAAVRRLADRLPQVRIHSLLVMGSPRFWQALNGRFLNELIARYGFMSPCIGCHLYLHSVRIPLSMSLGSIPIISGERESHDGVLKINQTSEVLTCYEAIALEFEVRLMFPLRRISDGGRIRDLLGLSWEEGEEQLGCVLSGNYRALNGGVSVTAAEALAYLETFAIPVTREIVAAYAGGHIPDHTKIANHVLTSLR